MIDLATSLQTALAGRYEIRRELGHGGMARVYLAQDLRHDREVAVKVLRPEIADAVGTERFLREIRLEGGLQHPQILPLFDSGEADGLPYYVMPYVPGESLRGRLAREKQLPIEEAVRIALEVADGLEYAHGRGIVHRDIKPENILLSQGHAIVADFGIARAVSAAGGERITGTGITVGTPTYMSPEQAGGADEVDGRSDLYSLGCVLFEMLVGEPPFTGRTAQAVIARHMGDRPPALRAVRPSVPAPVAQVVDTLLEKVPADRFASAADFSRALRTSQTVPRPSVTARPPRSWRKPAFGLALVLLVLGLARLLLSHRAPALDPNLVLVFPLRESGPNAVAGVGEDVATYIGHVLDGSAPLQWDEAAGIGGMASRPPPSGDQARKLSRRRGAGYFIDGAIVRGSDSVTVLVRLHDVAGDSLLRRAGRTGAAGASEARLGAMAVTDLLPGLLAPGRRVDVGGLADRSPAAIANFLQGERAYRQGQFLLALDHFKRALAEDSLFALAAVKGAQSASWLDRQEEEAERLASLAVRGEARLPRRLAELSRGLRSYMAGSADSAVIHLRSALALAPEWSEAWMALGEVYWHLLPGGARPDSIAEDAFRRAWLADSAFTPPLYHLAEIAFRSSPDSARRLADRLRRAGPAGDIVDQLELTLSCDPGSSPAGWLRRAGGNYHAVLEAAHSLASDRRHLACAEAAFRGVFEWDSTDDSHRFGALFGLQNLLVRERRFDEARALLQSAAAQRSGGPYFFLLDAAAVGAFDQEADDVARGQGETYASMTTRRLWILGLWAGRRGNVAMAQGIASALKVKADSSRDRRDRLFADIVAAHAALAAGDSSEALGILEGLRPAARRNEIAWSLWEPLGPERLVLAELLLSRGEIRRATEVASELDAPGPIAYLLYQPASLALRARAADTEGDSAASARYRARVAALTRADEGEAGAPVQP